MFLLKRSIFCTHRCIYQCCFLIQYQFIHWIRCFFSPSRECDWYTQISLHSQWTILLLLRFRIIIYYSLLAICDHLTLGQGPNPSLYWCLVLWIVITQRGGLTWHPCSVLNREECSSCYDLGNPVFVPGFTGLYCSSAKREWRLRWPLWSVLRMLVTDIQKNILS